MSTTVLSHDANSHFRLEADTHVPAAGLCWRGLPSVFHHPSIRGTFVNQWKQIRNRSEHFAKSSRNMTLG
ncbi:hypothetical protein, partial [Mesorhizobium sp. M7A.T.Ca.TU.009.02.1.1]|uniref:hypothetical protein n=1 Tax=Mesorhizobium sp. M7A.T.Ca.TU.009.02.1.1 TaxID=2496791 RepID=UPI0019D2ABA2